MPLFCLSVCFTLGLSACLLSSSLSVCVSVSRVHLSSVFSEDSDPSREPQDLMKAECLSCGATATETLMPRPVDIEVNVFYRSDNTPTSWCKCPYRIAVACTCVRH